MEKNNFILFEQVLDGEPLEFRYIPFIIFRGTMEEAPDNLVRLIAKYLAGEDDTLFADKEQLVVAKRDRIVDIIYNWRSGYSLSVEDRIIWIRDITIIDDKIDDKTSKEHHIRDVIFDEWSKKFIDDSNLADDCLPDEIFSVELVFAKDNSSLDVLY